MKFVICILMVSLLSACGTIGGAISGAGEDLNKAGNYIKKVGT